MEQWILANLPWLVTAVGGSAVIYWRLGKVESDFKKHTDPDNKAPHPSCPVHTEQFNGLLNSLNDIKESVRRLDERIFVFMRSNGYHDRTE